MPIQFCLLLLKEQLQQNFGLAREGVAQPTENHGETLNGGCKKLSLWKEGQAVTALGEGQQKHACDPEDSVSCILHIGGHKDCHVLMVLHGLDLQAMTCGTLEQSDDTVEEEKQEPQEEQHKTS